jgi:hypothetical protein
MKTMKAINTKIRMTQRRQSIQRMKMTTGMMMIMEMIVMLGVKMAQPTTTTSTPATHLTPNLLPKSKCCQSLRSLLQFQMPHLHLLLTRVQPTLHLGHLQKMLQLLLLQKMLQQITQQAAQRMILLHLLNRPARKVLMLLLLRQQRMHLNRRLQEVLQPVHQEAVQQMISLHLLRISLVSSNPVNSNLLNSPALQLAHLRLFSHPIPRLHLRQLQKKSQSQVGFQTPTTSASTDVVVLCVFAGRGFIMVLVSADHLVTYVQDLDTRPSSVQVVGMGKVEVVDMSGPEGKEGRRAEVVLVERCLGGRVFLDVVEKCLVQIGLWRQWQEIVAGF